MRPMTLAEWQSRFKQYLFTGHDETWLTRHVAAAREVGPTRRLDVYRDAYYMRQQEALAHDFPALLALVGDAAFGRVTAAYLAAFPSTRPSLRWLGEHLPGWLSSEAGHRHLANLAALEWAVLDACDAADATAATPTALDGLPPEQWAELRVGLHPSLTALATRTNARAIWRAVRGGRPLPPLMEAHEDLVIWRSHRGVRVEAVPRAHAVLLAALADDPSLSAGCEALSRSLPSSGTPEEVASFLHDGLDQGWFTLHAEDGHTHGCPPR